MEKDERIPDRAKSMNVKTGQSRWLRLGWPATGGEECMAHGR